MRHADSAPSVYGNSILWLSGFAKQKIMRYGSFIGGKLLSHSIELPYTEGAESACLISRRDSALWVIGRAPTDDGRALQMTPGPYR